MPTTPKDNDTMTVLNRLAAVLMKQAKITVDPQTVQEHPQYQRFLKVAQETVKYLGSGDYLSLVTAMDNDDDGTLIQLLRKATQNRRTRTTEALVVPLARSGVVGHDLLVREGYSHRIPPIRPEHRDGFMDLMDHLRVRFQVDADGAFIVDLREDARSRTAARLAETASRIVSEAAHTPVSRMVQNGLFTDWIGNRTKDLTEDDADDKSPARWFNVVFSRSYPHDEKVVAVREHSADAAVERASKHLRDASKYDTADFNVEVRPGHRPGDASRVAAILESQHEGKRTMRQKKPTMNEAVLGMTAVPPLQRIRQLAGLDGDDYSMTVEVPEIDDCNAIGCDTDAANDDQLDAVNDDFETGVVVDPDAEAGEAGSAVTQAEAALKTALSLIDEMTIAEYREFCDRADRFASEVRGIVQSGEF